MPQPPEINIPITETPDPGLFDPDHIQQLRIDQADPATQFSGHMAEAEQNIVYLAAFAHRLAVATRAGTKDTVSALDPDRSPSYERSFGTGRTPSTPEVGLKLSSDLGRVSLKLAENLPKYGDYVYKRYEPYREALEADFNNRLYTDEYYKRKEDEKNQRFWTSTGESGNAPMPRDGGIEKEDKIRSPARRRLVRPVAFLSGNSDHDKTIRELQPEQQTTKQKRRKRRLFKKGIPPGATDTQS